MKEEKLLLHFKTTLEIKEVEFFTCKVSSQKLMSQNTMNLEIIVDISKIKAVIWVTTDQISNLKAISKIIEEFTYRNDISTKQVSIIHQQGKILVKEIKDDYRRKEIHLA